MKQMKSWVESDMYALCEFVVEVVQHLRLKDLSSQSYQIMRQLKSLPFVWKKSTSGEVNSGLIERVLAISSRLLSQPSKDSSPKASTIDQEAANTAYEREKEKIEKLKSYCVQKSKKWMTEM